MLRDIEKRPHQRISYFGLKYLDRNDYSVAGKSCRDRFKARSATQPGIDTSTGGEYAAQSGRRHVFTKIIF
jgi:hypothetical protein